MKGKQANAAECEGKRKENKRNEKREERTKKICWNCTIQKNSSQPTTRFSFRCLEITEKGKPKRSSEFQKMTENCPEQRNENLSL